MTSLWISEYQNWNAFFTPYISHTLRIQNIFCCTRCDTRTGLFNFWKFSMSQEVKKGPFVALTFESSKNFMLRYFQKLMWFYLLVTKDSLLGKVWGKLFSDAKCPGPLLQRSPVKLSIIFSNQKTSYINDTRKFVSFLTMRYIWRVNK